MDKQRTAADILNGMIELLSNREGNYDHPNDNFQRIADLFNVYLKTKPYPIVLEPEDIAILMILMKVAREEFKHVEDNILDIIGYSICNLRIHDIKNETKIGLQDM